jgi:hypothetical protein
MWKRAAVSGCEHIGIGRRQASVYANAIVDGQARLVRKRGSGYSTNRSDDGIAVDCPASVECDPEVIVAFIDSINPNIRQYFNA